MKTYLKTSIAFTLLILIFTINQSFAQIPNYSGNWHLDKQKTDFDHWPQWVVPLTYNISQSTEQVTTDKTFAFENADTAHSKITLPLDGTTVQNNSSNGQPATQSCTVNADKSIHLTIVVPESDGGQDHVTEDWALADNGNTLIVTRHMVQSDKQEYTVKAVYEK